MILEFNSREIRKTLSIGIRRTGMLLPDVRPYGPLIAACGTKALSRCDAEPSRFMKFTHASSLLWERVAMPNWSRIKQVHPAREHLE